MIDFFVNKPTDLAFSYVRFPKWDYIQRMYTFSIDGLVSYYNSRSLVVNNKHLLSKIIGLGFPGLELDEIEYLKNVETNSRYLAKQFRLVNNITNGDIFHNIFYKKNSIEIITQVDFDYDFKDVYANYANYSPLRVVYTEETDLDFHLLDGRKPKATPSVTVFELDITLMLLMFRSWGLRRKKFGLTVNENVFVGSVVIPNAIKSMVDIIIFNRFLKIAKGEKIPEFKLKHPMFVYDLSRGVDDILRRVVPNVVNTNIRLEHFLNTIPTLYNKNMFSTLKLSRHNYTSQSLWSLWMARIKYIDILLELMGESGRKRNLVIMYSLPYDIRELRNRKTNLFYKLEQEKSITDEYMDTINRVYDKVFFTKGE